MIKFGDKVQVTSKDFFEGTKGVVISYERLDDSYTVQLSHGVRRDIRSEHLVKLGGKKCKTRK